MKALSILVFGCLTAFAQTPPPAAAPPIPNLPDDTVIATFDDDGYSMTVGDFKKLFAVLPPEAQQNFMKQKEDFFRGYGVMRKLAHIAESQKLDEGSPTRESLAYYRMRILVDAELQAALRNVSVPPEEAHQYYDAHKDKYKEVHLKAIYLSYSAEAAPSSSSTAGTPKRTEEQAKALADKLVADLHAGADFVKLVAQYSDDATSKAKDGDFATIHGSDNIPEDVRSVVMALKTGEISAPIRQPNAIYLFRAESVTYKPLEEVREEILNQLRMDHYHQWMDQMNHSTKVEFKSPAFFGTAPPDPKLGGAH